MEFLRRLGVLAFALLISLDQLAHVLVAAPFYLLGISDELPNADETISSRVGRYSIRGYRWAKLAEWLINLLFFWQVDETGKRNHCARSIGA